MQKRLNPVNCKSPVQLEKGARVLVRLPNWIGDVILCTPALAALRKARPDLRITALVKPSVRVAVEGLEGVNEVRTLSGTSFGETLSAARELRGQGFRTAIIFPKGFREALLAKLAGISVRMGLDTDHRAFLLTHPVAFAMEDWHRHHADQFAKVLSPLGVSLSGEGLAFPLANADREEAVRVLADAGLTGVPFAAFHVTASKAARAWHPERFGQVAQDLFEKTGLKPVLLGLPSDKPVHGAFQAACPGAVDLAGLTSLKGMAAVIEKAELFVGNDSGPMHVAAAVGAKVVALFGPGAPHKTAPYLLPDRCRVVYAALPCSPCRQSFWEECKPSPTGKPPCLEGIHPDAVLAACLDLLGERGWVSK